MPGENGKKPIARFGAREKVHSEVLDRPQVLNRARTRPSRIILPGLTIQIVLNQADAQKEREDSREEIKSYRNNGNEFRSHNMRPWGENFVE
jgi:hypothetical protein